MENIPPFLLRLLPYVLLIIPAYIANMTPLLVAKALRFRTHPLDFGKKFIDGRRVLGDGKSIEGFVSGIVAGSATGAVLYVVFPDIVTPLRGFLASLGTVVGDCFGSFIKRRIGLERGKPLPLIDQLMFYVFAVAFLTLDGVYFPLDVFIILAVVTAVLHLASNVVAYFIGIKDVPW